MHSEGVGGHIQQLRITSEALESSLTSLIFNFWKTKRENTLNVSIVKVLQCGAGDGSVCSPEHNCTEIIRFPF